MDGGDGEGREQLANILRQMAMAGGMGGGGRGGGRGPMRDSMQQLAAAIGNQEDDSAQYAGLVELCNSLNMATEETLMAIRPDRFVMPILGCLQKDYNPDLMLVAARALTYLIDSIPVTSQVLAGCNGIEVVCSKLLNIMDIELAEQCLTALQKVSKENASAVLQGGGLQAMLGFIDFFSTSVQRTAMASAANVCRRVKPSSFAMAAPVLPTIRNFLRHEDAKMAESAFVCLNNILRGVVDDTEKVQEVVGEAAPNILEVLELKQCDATFNAALQVLANAISGSVQVAEMFIELGTVHTLLGILQHNEQAAMEAFALPPPNVSPGSLRSPQTGGGPQVASELPSTPPRLVSPMLKPGQPGQGTSSTPPGGPRPAAAAVSGENMKDACAALTFLLPRVRTGFVAQADRRASKKLSVGAVMGTDTPSGSPTARGGREFSQVREPSPDEEDEDEDQVVEEHEDDDEEWEEVDDEIEDDESDHDMVPQDSSASMTGGSPGGRQSSDAMFARATSITMENSTSHPKTADDPRWQLFVRSPYLLERVAEALPCVMRLRLENDHPRLRDYALEFVSRCVHFADTPTLVANLNDSPIADLLCAALSEPLAFQAKAIHIVAQIHAKVGDVYDPVFMREGVTGALAGIKNAVGTLPKPLPPMEELVKSDNGWCTALASATAELLSQFVSKAGQETQAALEAAGVLLRTKGSFMDGIDHFVEVMTSPHGASTFELVSSGCVTAMVEGLKMHNDPINAVAGLVSRCASKTMVASTSDASPDRTYGPPSVLLRFVRQLQTMVSQNENFAAPEAGKLGMHSQVHLKLIPHELDKESTDESPRRASRDRGGRGAGAPPGRGRGAGNGPRGNPGREVTVGIDPLAGISAVAGFIATKLLPGESRDHRPTEGRDEEEEEDDVVEEILPDLDKGDDAEVKRKRTEKPTNPRGPPGSQLHIRIGNQELPHSMTMVQVVQRYVQQSDEDRQSASPAPRRGMPPELLAMLEGLRRPTTSVTLHYSTEPFPSHVKPPQEREAEGFASPTDPILVVTADFRTSGVVAVENAVTNSFVTTLPKVIDTPLTMLRVLHAAVSKWASVREWFRIRACDLDDLVEDPGVHPNEFVNVKLTNKAVRHVTNPVLAGQLTEAWCTTLAMDAPFLFTSVARKYFFEAAFLGMSRSLQRILEMKTEMGQSGDSTRPPRIQRRKMRVWRNQPVECCKRVLELRSDDRVLFEFEFYGEEGSGLGPTLEFYTLVGTGIRQKSLRMWRSESDACSSEEEGNSVNPIHGLYPSPGANVQMFSFLGGFLARAVLDKRIPCVRLSRPLLALLRGDALALDDLLDVSPELYDTLATILLAHHKHTSILPFTKPCDINDLALNFTLPGVGADEIELHREGRNEDVDERNMDRYAREVVEATFKSSVGDCVRAFRSAFHKTIPIYALKILTLDEISGLFGGHDQPITMAELEQHTVCDHGFTNSSPQVRQLFEVLVDMPAEDQRRFFQFLTGSPMLPVGGLAYLRPRFTVVRKTNPDGATAERQQLPSSMTCQNFLKLPAYESKEQLKAKLYTAMNEGADEFNFT